jgi:hypothetical protein
MVNFTNPGVLGDAAYFRRYYEVSYVLPSNHILISQFELNLRWLNSIFILFVNLLCIHLSFFHACVCVCERERERSMYNCIIIGMAICTLICLLSFKSQCCAVG